MSEVLDLKECKPKKKHKPRMRGSSENRLKSDWQRVENALLESSLGLMSVDKLVTASGVSAEVIRDFVHVQRKLRASFALSHDGKPLVALKDKTPLFRERLAELRSYITKVAPPTV